MNGLLTLGVLGVGLILLKRSRRPTIRIARNPKRSRNPSSELARALAISETFHGTVAEVIELAPEERRLPRYVVALGSVPVLNYQPDEHSKRGGVEYFHELGDRGFGQPSSEERPVLAVDPTTKRPLLVAMRSPVRMDAERGLVG